jgi:hypothetical protein
MVARRLLKEYEMKKSLRKIPLKRETIRTLVDGELQRVDGANEPTFTILAGGCETTFLRKAAAGGDTL